MEIHELPKGIDVYKLEEILNMDKRLFFNEGYYKIFEHFDNNYILDEIDIIKSYFICLSVLKCESMDELINLGIIDEYECVMIIDEPEEYCSGYYGKIKSGDVTYEEVINDLKNDVYRFFNNLNIAIEKMKKG